MFIFKKIRFSFSYVNLRVLFKFNIKYTKSDCFISIITLNFSIQVCNSCSIPHHKKKKKKIGHHRTQRATYINPIFLSMNLTKTACKIGERNWYKAHISIFFFPHKKIADIKIIKEFITGVNPSMMLLCQEFVYF